jgi:hypothetical protein
VNYFLLELIDLFLDHSIDLDSLAIVEGKNDIETETHSEIYLNVNFASSDNLRVISL